MGKSSGKNSNNIAPVFDLKGLLYNPLVHVLLIAAAGFLAYSNTFHGPFQWDEVEFIVGNPIIEDLSYFVSPSKASGSVYYPLLRSRPVGYLTFALNYRFHGLNVTGYHIINLLIHIMNAVLVYFLVLFTFGTPYFRNHNSPSPPLILRGGAEGGGVTLKSSLRGFAPTNNVSPFVFHFSLLIPLAVALLFVAHPVQTEAVTYVFQRLASLVSMFYLLSLVLYVKGRLSVQKSEVRSQKLERNLDSTLKTQNLKLKIQSPVIWYLLSILSAVLAMKTKENAITLPLVIMLYEFLFFSGPVKTRLLRLAPFLLTLLIIPLTLIGTDKPAGEIISEMTDPAAMGSQGIPKNEYLFTQLRVIVTYLRLLFLPVNQNIAYDYPLYHSLFDPPVFLSFLFLTALFGIAVYLIYIAQKRRSAEVRSQKSEEESREYSVSSKQTTAYYLLPATHYRLIAFGIFWFFMTISVESSIIPLPMLIDEYRIYLPSVGIFMSVVTGVFMLVVRVAERNEKVALSMLLLAVAALTAATYVRNTLWMDNISLWQDVVRKSPNLYRGYTNLGKAYFEKGQYKKAIDMFERVVALRPSNFEAYNNRANAFSETPRLQGGAS